MIGRPVIVLLVAGAFVGGCGGGGVPSGDPPGSFAGYSEGEAVSSAEYILRSQLAEPESPLFQKELGVADLEQGAMADGKRAWIAHLEDFGGAASSWCLLVRAAEGTAVNRGVVYDVQRCATSGS